jgi:hypothetical protein
LGFRLLTCRFLVRVEGDAAFAQGLGERLWGEARTVSTRTLLHVGFCHSGTTSLQQNFFARRSDIFYCTPVGDCGGIFSYLKYEEDTALVEHRVQELCEQYIWARLGPHQRLVLSDETFVEQPEVYYTPQKMPIGTIAQRLRSLFPDASILFTIRNQLDYVVSCYLNLKRNYAHLANRSIEDFDAWFAGNLTQMANLYLRNLDYSRAITTFQRTFGKDAVAVLPLESLGLVGAEGYLRSIGDLLSIDISAADLENFRPVRNRRISVLEDSLLTHWHDPAYRGLYDSLAVAVGPARLRDLFDAAEPARVALDERQIAVIQQRCADGNLYLERQFGLDLSGVGYPMPDIEPRLIHRPPFRLLARARSSPAASYQRAAASS